MPVRAVLPVLLLVAALAGCGDGGPFPNAVGTTSTTSDPVSDTTVETTAGSDETDESDVVDGNETVVAGIDFGVLDLPPGDPYDEYTEFVDDTGTIMVEVPTDWSDIDTEPVEAESDGDAIDLPRISAEPVTTEGYIEGLVAFSHDPRDDSEAEELEETAEAWELEFECECEDSADFDYDDGSYTGLAQLWTDCFDKGLGHLVISTLVGEDHLLVQVFLATDADIDADIGAATRIIETFSFTGE